MTAIKAYLLRLILCAFLTALAGALLRGKRAGRIAALCGGCLLLFTALGPLLRVDPGALPDLITGLTRDGRAELARERNDELLRQLVETQTAAWIEAQARELGMELRCEVRAEAAGEMAFVPRRAILRGSWTPEQRSALSELLSRELELPPTCQSWEGG